ncbi:MAG: hypothetical protein Q4F13_09650 [Pseudomonadota bacterium]|nr:hypothetical protein [Pseudomonadota bacterium]
MATEKELKSAVESMYHVGGDALAAIRMLAQLALHECDRGPGKLSGHLIVRALEEISIRAGDAEDGIDYEAEKLGISDTPRFMQRQARACALSGRV